MIDNDEITVLKKMVYDEIHELAKRYSNIISSINDMRGDLNKKVNLKSEQIDGPSTTSRLGSGTVSISDTALIGNSTLFLSELSVGDTIKVSLYSFIIKTIDSSSYATIENPTNISLSDQIYSIIKPTTKEVLSGAFSFGNLENAFQGKIGEESIFEHYGRMTQPNDLVNLNFVKRSVTPVLVLARKAIQRTGDTIESLDESSPYEYIYNNCDLYYNNIKMIIGQDDTYRASSFEYHGVTTGDYNIITRKDLKQIVDSYTSINSSYGLVSKNYSGAPSGALITLTPDINNNLTEYFTINNSTLTCQKDCVFLFNFKASGKTVTGQDCTISLSASLTEGGQILDQDISKDWSSKGSTGGDNGVAVGKIALFAISKIQAGQTVVLDFSTSGTTHDFEYFRYSACISIMSA